MAPNTSGLLPQARPRDPGKVLFAKCPPSLLGPPQVVAITAGVPDSRPPWGLLSFEHPSEVCALQGGWIQCPCSAHLCTKAEVTCGFCTKACCAWHGATLANAVSILACHIKEIYVAWASAKSANMLCFRKSAKSLSSVIYSGNTRPFLILGMLHLSSLVSGLCIQKGCLLCLRTTFNIFIWVIIHSQMCVTWDETKPHFLIVEGSHAPCGSDGKYRNSFLKNVAYNLVPKETAVHNLVCVFSVFLKMC